MLDQDYDINDLFDSEDLESVERKIEFERLLKVLSARDRRIVVLNAFGYTQEEIGSEMGLTQQRIQQILSNICKRA